MEEEAPTCTNDGHAAYYHCPDCGKYFKDADCIEETTWEELSLPATGHKTELRNAKEPTCTEDGYLSLIHIVGPGVGPVAQNSPTRRGLKRIQHLPRKAFGIRCV